MNARHSSETRFLNIRSDYRLDYKGEKMSKDIIIRGANENNLKNLDVVIPRDKMVVLTGLSGSGKSSLSIDTIYEE